MKKLIVKPGTRIRLREYDTGEAQTREIKREGAEAVKERARKSLVESLEKLSKSQELLYANDRFAVLVILQARDAAGKDGTIRHVMSGVNPQGCQVYSFKQPSAEELDHTFLWRCMRALPERGRIGIFNRSYYEEALVVRVHPELLDAQHLPTQRFNRKFWRKRFEDINAFEHHLVRNGTIVLKFFLHVSKAEQKRRFIERIEDPRKNWKFSMGDLGERKLWDDYTDAYEEIFRHTSTRWAPWYVIPADYKWTARAMVAQILSNAMRSLDLSFPELSKEERRELEAARRALKRS